MCRAVRRQELRGIHELRITGLYCAIRPKHKSRKLTLICCHASHLNVCVVGDGISSGLERLRDIHREGEGHSQGQRVV